MRTMMREISAGLRTLKGVNGAAHTEMNLIWESDNYAAAGPFKNTFWHADDGNWYTKDGTRIKSEPLIKLLNNIEQRELEKVRAE
jgi:hypothetical protein